MAGHKCSCVGHVCCVCGKIRSFYLEIWSKHANLIKVCKSWDEYDQIVKELTDLGYVQDEDFFAVDERYQEWLKEGKDAP